MKPVGRERDKQIVELKGWKLNEANKLYGFPPNAYVLFNIPDWSTSWNDAKELWDELPLKSEYVKYEGYGGKIIHLIVCISGMFEGANFPDAVSQAWIKWKESR